MVLVCHAVVRPKLIRASALWAVGLIHSDSTSIESNSRHARAPKTSDACHRIRGLECGAPGSSFVVASQAVMADQPD